MCVGSVSEPSGGRHLPAPLTPASPPLSLALTAPIFRISSCSKDDDVLFAPTDYVFPCLVCDRQEHDRRHVPDSLFFLSSCLS